MFKMERSKSHLNLSYNNDRSTGGTNKGQLDDKNCKNGSTDSLNRKNSSLPSRSLTPNFNRELTFSQKLVKFEFWHQKVLLVGAFSLKEKSPTLTVSSFLVGAFSLKEKSPTLTVSSFFFVFFQLTISL